MTKLWVVSMHGKNISFSFVGLAFVFLIFSTSSLSVGTNSIVWEDNFDDQNYDGWTVTEGSFTAQNDQLEGATADEMNRIFYNSNIASGTWSFDIYHADVYYCPYVWFIVNTLDSSLLPWDGYLLHISPYDGVEIWVDDGADSENLGSCMPSGGIKEKWLHLDITRDTSGHMCLYVNSILSLEVDSVNFNTSSYFYFTCYDRHVIDNIIVYDEVLPITPSSLFGLLELELLIACIVIILIIVIGVVYGIIRWKQAKKKSYQFLEKPPSE